MPEDAGAGARLEERMRDLEASNAELRRANALLEDALRENRQSAAEATRNDARFRIIFESSPLAIMCTDSEGVITTCNERAQALFGAPPERLIGFSYKAIRDGRMKAAIAGALRGERTHFEGEYLTVTGNVLREMGAIFSPACAPDGSVLGVIGIFKDIAVRKRIEREKEELIQSLEKALREVKVLRGILSICAACKKVRDDQGCWNQIEQYMQAHTEAQFSHGLCPDCAERLYPDVMKDKSK